VSEAPVAAEQLPLIPVRPPTLGNMEPVSLDQLPPDEALLGPPPSAALVESIRRWGVLTPILVRAVGGQLQYYNPDTLVSGRRRIKALRALHAEAHAAMLRAAKAAKLPPGADLNQDPAYRTAYEQWRDRNHVPARVISDPEGTLTDGRTEALVVMTNAVRSDNPATDLRALANLLDQLTRAGLSEKACLAEASKVTGLATGTVKQRIRLLDLSPELQDDFFAGRLGYTVALHASRLGPDGQALLAERLDAGNPATLDLVKAAKRDSVRATQTALVDALPDLPNLTGRREADLPGHARSLAEHLAEIKMPIMQEAAGVIRDLLAALEEKPGDD